MKKYFRDACLITVGVFIGFFLLSHPRHKLEKIPSGEEILEQSSYNTILHSLVVKPACVEMNADELSQAHQAVEVLKTFPEISKMHIAAVRYFGEYQYRREDKKSVVLCVPSKIKSAAGAVLLEQGEFSRKFSEPDLLRTAFMLDSDAPEIINNVANTAFNSEGVYYSTGDARPLARLVLAKFPSKAKAWSDQAFSSISDTDDLGISAAMVAIATEHPQALQRTADLIQGILSKNSNVIKFKDVGKLNQLSFALALARNNAQPYTSVLTELANRKVESWAPPFGMIEVDPVYLCEVMGLIGGNDADVVLKKPWCASQK